MPFHIKLRVYSAFVLLMLFMTSHSMSQSNLLYVDEIRDSITDENCTGHCWLGIEPGVTTEAELVEVLNLSGYFYETNNYKNPTDLWYWVDWTDASFLVEDSYIIVQTYNDMVSRVYMSIANPPSKDALLLFPELPDVVFADGSYNRLYADRQVIVTIAGGVERGSVQSDTFSLSLIDARRADEIAQYFDMRPCALPTIICATPLRPPTLFPITSTEPTLILSWSDENGADWYKLLVNSGEIIIEQRVEASRICDAQRCTLTLSEPLTDGMYTIQVQAQNLAQVSEWSEEVEIILPLTSKISHHLGN